MWQANPGIVRIEKNNRKRYSYREGVLRTHQTECADWSIERKLKMSSRIALIESFKDTLRIIKEDSLLRECTEKMKAGTRLFMPEFDAICPQIKREKPETIIREDTTFHCAQLQINGNDKVAVLNFANAYTPGGSVKDGAMAQEECLCRSSNLYSALTIPYLLKNYYKWNAKNTGAMGSDAVVYSPDVTVFKTDDPVPKLMEEWFKVDVISSAAPYYDKDKKKPVSEDKLRDVFRKRIENILSVAAANDVDVLVLGAFGCGAFNNPPELVADEFYELVVKIGFGRFFRKVIFAIKSDGERGKANYEAFASRFKDD